VNDTFMSHQQSNIMRIFGSLLIYRVESIHFSHVMEVIFLVIFTDYLLLLSTLNISIFSGTSCNLQYNLRS
jgi:hypothetical protein